MGAECSELHFGQVKFERFVRYVKEAVAYMHLELRIEVWDGEKQIWALSTCRWHNVPCLLLKASWFSFGELFLLLG